MVVTDESECQKNKDCFSLRAENGKLQTDVAGSVVRVVEITHPNKTYKADALHDMLFALANWSNALPMNDTLRRYLGTLNIDQMFELFASVTSPDGLITRDDLQTCLAK